MKHLLSEAEWKLERMKKQYERTYSQLEVLPTGTLEVSERGEKIYYCVKQNGKRSSIDPEDPLVYLLKERRLREKCCGAMKNNIALLQNLLDNFMEFDPNIVMKRMPKGYQNPGYGVMEQMGFPDMRTWAEGGVSNSDFYPEELVVKTQSGLFVRSRIEGVCIDIYNDLGVPVRYEDLIILPNGKKRRPDFHLLVPGVYRSLYHEHNGMMSDKQYVYSYLTKEREYLDAGLVPYRDVLFTFDNNESRLDDIRAVDMQLIRRRIIDFLAQWM